jgi:adenylate kinase
MRIVLLGAPGSGKGTQGELLSTRHGLVRIATGDILRSEIAAGTPLGQKAEEFVGSGSLVPDDLMVDMIAARLCRPDMKSGFILDGFPRSIPQAKALEKMLAAQGVGIDAVVKLDLPKKALIDRLTSRWICSKCNAVYNVISSPPRVAGVCDRCGAALSQREDDTQYTVRRRLNVYEMTTAPLIDYYDARGLLLIIDGERSVAEVAAEIEEMLDLREDS